MSKTKIWIGRIFFIITILFLAFDGVIHMMDIPVVADAFAKLGYPATFAFQIGLIELICLALYIIPKTSILGALLLTGYLGGAVATNARVEAPLFSTVLFPVYVAILMWGALYVFDERVRSLLPFKK